MICCGRDDRVGEMETFPLKPSKGAFDKLRASFEWATVKLDIFR
jgi:hypothetical protein